jgi:hypothetical protein
MSYAIWNLETGNRVGWYRSKQEAFAEVRDAVARFGSAFVGAWALALHEGEAVEAIAEGDELLALALAAAV